MRNMNLNHLLLEIKTRAKVWKFIVESYTGEDVMWNHHTSSFSQIEDTKPQSVYNRRFEDAGGAPDLEAASSDPRRSDRADSTTSLSPKFPSKFTQKFEEIAGTPDLPTSLDDSRRLERIDSHRSFPSGEGGDYLAGSNISTSQAPTVKRARIPLRSLPLPGNTMTLPTTIVLRARWGEGSLV